MPMIIGKGHKNGNRIQITFIDTINPLRPKSEFSANRAYLKIMVIIWIMIEIMIAPIM